MKTAIPFIICLLIATFSRAQVTHHFPHTNATWGIFSGVYYSNQMDPINSYYVGDTHYETAAGDTVINSLSYIKLCPSDESGNILSQSQPKLLREDGDKVYSLTPDGNDILLYDFSLQAGDTITLYLFYQTQHQTLTVDSVRTLQIGGVDRKCIYLNYRSSYAVFKTHNLNIPSIDPVMWIEGIGSIDGVMYPYGGADIVDGIEFLTCFKENNTLKYGTVCNVTASIKDGVDDIKQMNVSFSPNPSVEALYFNLEENTTHTLQVINTVGQVMLNTITSSAQYKMDISSLVSGTYFIMIENEKKEKSIQKLLKL